MALNNDFNYFGIMLECSRNAVPNIKFLKEYIDDIAKMGYNCLQLYTEETYELEDEPMFGYLRGKFTKNELKEINAYSKAKGVEIMPCIQTLAHLNCALRWYPYCSYTDCDDILLIDDDRTYALIEKMISTMRECFDTEYIHIGMDEAHMVGLGKYLDKHGYKNRFEILTHHLRKVIEIVKKYDFKPMIWSDMFFRLANGGQYYSRKPFNFPEGLFDAVPSEVALCYWDYYSKEKELYDNMFREHKRFNNEIWFAGGCWSWGGFTPSNYTSMEAHSLAIPSCKEFGVKNVLITSWGDNGHETSKIATHASLFHVICLAKGITDVNVMDEEFKKLFGISMQDALKLDYANEIERHNSLYDFIGANANNPAKYMLYNDPFMGIYDSTANRTATNDYKRYAKELLNYVNDEKFGYVFDTQQKLCDVLSIKYALGVKTRKAYLAKDMVALKKIIGNYKTLNKKLIAFIDAFKKQWFIENKAFGWEVQDARLGGLLQRLKTCAERLTAYVNGEIDSIPELEQTIEVAWLNPKLKGKTLYWNQYNRNMTAGVM